MSDERRRLERVLTELMADNKAIHAKCDPRCEELAVTRGETADQYSGLIARTTAGIGPALARERSRGVGVVGRSVFPNPHADPCLGSQLP